jgi:peptidoglycan lytic transglycosylase G
VANYRNSNSKRRRRIPRIWLIVLAVLLVVVVAAAIVEFRIYDENLQPVSGSQKSVVVTIKSGATTAQIADLLHQDGLVRSSWSFEWYVRSQQDDDLQAGTYDLNPSQGVANIVATITKGKVATKLVTILPGKRLDQVRAALINSGFSPSAVDNALQPAQYAGLAALVDKPAGADLEGYLYPDSFQKDATTNPTVIITESLNEMGEQLTPSLRAAFAAEGLNTYQGITLASMVQQEVSKPADQAQAAQVFLKRLGLGMPLGSDVTAFYGAILAGQPPSVNYDSPYNTLIHTGLPPTPISNVTAQALQAAAHPATTDWLYFVTGDNGTTYFEQTAAQHQADVTAYCHNLCAQDSQ